MIKSNKKERVWIDREDKRLLGMYAERHGLKKMEAASKAIRALAKEEEKILEKYNNPFF